MSRFNIQGSLTEAQQAALRDDIVGLIKRSLAKGRRLTVGTIVGSTRTKSFPENPIVGQQVKVMFVADVKLREFEGQPIMTDVYIANQAHQLVTGSDADGLPVTVELSESGTATVIARASLSNAQSSTKFSPIHSVNGLDLSYVYGLRVKNTSSLSAALLAKINDWRTSQSQTVLTSSEVYIEDPQIDYHGVDYYIGYISPSDGERFLSALVGITCAIATTNFDAFGVGTTLAEKTTWWDTQVATGYEGVDPWGAHNTRLVCT